jgi:hypothetical protein
MGPNPYFAWARMGDAWPSCVGGVNAYVGIRADVDARVDAACRGTRRLGNRRRHRGGADTGRVGSIMRTGTTAPAIAGTDTIIRAGTTVAAANVIIAELR